VRVRVLAAILHRGADLGTLELADIETLILSHIDHARPRCHRPAASANMHPDHAILYRAEALD
jgi:hypothetical protein